jgi:hypothetical protein
MRKAISFGEIFFVMNELLQPAVQWMRAEKSLDNSSK